MALLDNLEVKATGSMDDALKKLDELLSKVHELPKSKTTNLRVNTTNTTTEIRKVSENVKRVVGEIDRGAKQIQKSTSKAADSALSKIGQLFSSIKRIAVYRFIRSAIKAVTQAFSEGIQNAYKWAVVNSDAFQQVMDTYATKSMYLKNTMGALASTILTALLPAFTWLVNKVVQVTNAVNEFIAALTGQDSYLRAREVAIQFGDAVEDATGKQKQLNQQLMKFDELNVIKTPKNNGRGDLEDVLNDAFERVDVSDKLKKVSELGKKIKDFISKTADKLKEWKIPEAVQVALDNVGKLIENIFSFAGKVYDKLKEFGLDERISQDLGNLFGMLGDIFGKANEIWAVLEEWGVTDTFASAIASAVMLFEKLAYIGASDGLKAIQNLLDTIGKLFKGDFVGSLKSAAAGIIDLIASVLRPFIAIMDSFGAFIDNLRGNKHASMLTSFEAGIDSVKNSILGLSAETGGGASRLKKNSTSTGGGSLVVKREATGLGLLNAKNGSSAGRSVLDSMTIDLRANGGFPEMGSIFAAGEKPGEAEFVGNINGRTGVASGQEITGIADAVYATGNEEASLLRELVAVVKAGGGSMQPSAAFGRFASQSIRLYKGVTG